MSIRPPQISVSATLVSCLLALVAAIWVAPPAGASSGCRTLRPRARTAPYLIAPCDGATVAEHHVVTFIVDDADAQAAGSTLDRPYLNLADARAVTDGQLAAGTNGTGVFEQLEPRAGHPHEWTLTVKPQTYRSWWDNHPGTCFVQIRQLDPATVSGVIESPIVTLHVAATRG